MVHPRYDITKGRWAPELLRGHGSGAFAIQCLQILGPGDVLQSAADRSVLETRRAAERTVLIRRCAAPRRR